MHKWYYTPKSCGILYVDPKYHDVVQPTVVSHGCYGNFHWRFFKQATKNYTAQLTAGYAVKYMDRMGGIVRHCQLTFTFSESTIETLEKIRKYDQS